MKTAKRFGIAVGIELALLTLAWFLGPLLRSHVTDAGTVRWLTVLHVRIILMAFVLLMSGSFGARIVTASMQQLSIHAIWFPMVLGIGFALSSPLIARFGGTMNPNLLKLLIPLAASAFAGFPLWLCLKDQFVFRDSDSKLILRGTEILSGLKAKEALINLAEAEQLTQGGKGIRIFEDCYLPRAREPQHLLIVGSPGSGKTQITYPILKQVLERGDKAIVWDVKGTYLQALYGQQDVRLLAPWDTRSMAWQPSQDIRNLEDCKQAAEILIPTNIKELQPYFSNASRDILRVVMGHLDAARRPWGWSDLWAAIGCGQQKLFHYLQQSAAGATAATHISGDNKSSHDVYSSLITAVAPLEALGKAWPGEGESLRHWMKDGKGTLIIGGLPQRSVLAMTTAKLAMRVMITELLSMPNDLNRRVWLFLDELATLGNMETLLDAFSLGREKGLCIVVGIQDIGKIEHLYGRELAKSMSNTFSTNIFLRCTDQGTSQWASECIGQQEAREEQVSQNRGQSRSSGRQHRSIGFSEGSSLQKVTRIKPAVLAAEIAAFKDLEGLLRVPGWPTAKLQWPKNPIPAPAELVIEAPWLDEKLILREKPVLPGTPLVASDPISTAAGRPVWKRERS